MMMDKTIEASSETPVLEIINLNKRYDEFKLKDVNFTVGKNSICGFIGVNGAGKTTTIKSMLGLTKKDAGLIRFFGREFTGNEKEIKNNIGVVFDASVYYEELSIKYMKLIISKSYKEWNEVVFQNYLKRFNLDESKKICNLSKGMKMKLSLAFALSHNAKFLIMDEPTSGLDPLIRKEVLGILDEFKSCGENSVFFSTHITSDLEKIADQLIMIHNGEIIFSKTKEEFYSVSNGASIEEFMIKYIEEIK